MLIGEKVLIHFLALRDYDVVQDLRQITDLYECAYSNTLLFLY